MTTYTVTDIRATTLDRGILVRDERLAVVATVTAENGDSVTFSRYADEDEWYADAAIRANGFPVFCHGEGSRVCAKQTPTPEVAAILDRAALDLWN